MEQLDKETIRKHLQTEIFGKELILLDSVDSTNDYAKRELESHGTVVITEQQEAGKGRMGRTWESPRGRSILMSILIRPERRLPWINLMNLATGLSVAQAIGELWALSPVVKWPNDVWIAGKKVCGVLAESQYRGEEMNKLVIGFGCNVNQQPDEFPKKLRWPATSLAIELGRQVDRSILLAKILGVLEFWYKHIQNAGVEQLLAEWKSRCIHRDAPVRMNHTKQVLNGIFRGLSPDGAALVEDASGRLRVVHSGDLTLLTAPEGKK
ncbi:MAG: biotin--[acetyl-CoA-carboxylase] ligase [Calditrichota bacterium]